MKVANPNPTGGSIFDSRLEVHFLGCESASRLLRVASLAMFALAAAVASAPSMAQPSQFSQSVTAVDVSERVTRNIYRPQIAAARDGSYAIAWEADVEEEFTREWKIAVQRYAPDGSEVGPTNYLDPESGCFLFDDWTQDGQQNVELAYNSTGGLLVLMEHYGEYHSGATFDFSSEITLGLVDATGAVIDLTNDPDCVQWKFIFPGADEQDRPRMVVLPNHIALTMDGFFAGSDRRNVGIQFFDLNLDKVGNIVIPHADEFSLNGFHAYPDIATNGSFMSFVWHECPYINPQGDVAECDIKAQFATVSGTTLTAVGNIIQVNAGDPEVTYNFRPSTAMNPSGASVIVWHDSRVGDGRDIFGQLYNSGGQAVGANFQISQTGAITEVQGGLRAEVAMRDDGSFMVVWGDSTNVRRALGRTYDANAQPTSDVMLLASAAGFQFGMPSIATNGSAYFITGLSRASDGTRGLFASTPNNTVAVEEGVELVEDAVLISYPNPFVNEVRVVAELFEPDDVTFEVVNLLGQVIVREERGRAPVGKSEMVLDTSGWPSGVFVARIIVGDTVTSNMLVKR